MSQPTWPVVGGEYPFQPGSRLFARVTAIEGGVVYYVHADKEKNYNGSCCDIDNFRRNYCPEDQSPIPKLVEALRLVNSEWHHDAPDDCYATGPRTGDPFQDYVACPGCAVQKAIDAALKGVR